jgi:hypothetical protein
MTKSWSCIARLLRQRRPEAAVGRPAVGERTPSLGEFGSHLEGSCATRKRGTATRSADG